MRTETESARIRISSGLPALAVVMLLTGCLTTVGPDYVPPETEMPDAWHQDAVRGLDDGESNLQLWWTVFNDEKLTDLIQRSAMGNLDLAQAYYRVKEARAQRGIAVSERFPDLNGVGSAERERLSEGTAAGVPGPRSRTDNVYSLGMDASWEVDVWGRITRNIESADADLEATYEDYRDVLVLLFGEVAATYIEVRTLQDRIRSTQKNIQTQLDTLKLVRDRYEAEIVPELDVRQAELNLARTEAALPTFRGQLAAAIHRLGVLLGQEPGALFNELSTESEIPKPPQSVTIGVPHDLLRQRPDIRQAERALAAQNAQIGVATADLYPRFTLNGFFEYQTTGGAKGSLVNSRNRAWGIGPSMNWNLFDGGNVRNSIHFQEALTEELLAFYENTVLLAQEQVETSMVVYVEEQNRRDNLERSVLAASQSVDLVDTLYRSGLTDFQNVLDMQRSLFEQEDQLAESKGFVSQSLVAIYTALGGGWIPQPQQLTDEIQDAQEHGEPIF